MSPSRDVQESSAWMRAAVTHCLNNLTPALLAASDFSVVMTELVGPAPGMDAATWDRSCDRCGVYVPTGKAFYTGDTTKTAVNKITGRKVEIIIAFGLCPDCTSKETGQAESWDPEEQS